MASSKRNSKGRTKKNRAWEWTCNASKKVYEKSKVATKCVVDWLRVHPIICHILAICAVLMSLAIIAHVAMTIGTRHNAKRTVPNFVGLTLSDAEHYASRRDLKIVVRDSLYAAGFPGGVVLEQDQAEGVIVKPGRKIYVTINSLHQRTAPVPYVAGYSLRQAKSRLEAAGFTISQLEYVEDIATNNVLAEFINGEQVVESPDSVIVADVGSGVHLQVGVKPGDEMIVVPNVLGFTLRDARNKLLEQGFNVGGLSFDGGITVRGRDTTLVYQQTILPKESACRGDYIALSLTNDTEKVSVSIAADEERIKRAVREKFVADSIAQAEKLLYDSIIETNKSLLNDSATQQSLVEDNFF